MYDGWIGHLFGGHTPDIIQRDGEQYANYVQTLTSTLAQMKGGISDGELRRITKNILSKTDRLKNIAISTTKTQGLRGEIVTLDEPDSSITNKSIKEANMIVEEINKERVEVGLEPINQGYRPENGGPSFICCLDVSILDALNTYDQAQQG